MTKEKKYVYGGVLIAGGLALLCDRVLFSPAPAPASTTEQQAYVGSENSPLGSQQSTAASAPVITRLAAAAFPRSLPEIESLDAIRDMFAPTPTVRSAMLNQPDVEDPDSGNPSSIPSRTGVVQRFLRNHTLTGVMIGKSYAFAIIDGRWMRVGERLDGCELARITGTDATFRCSSGIATLSVAGVLSPPKR